MRGPDVVLRPAPRGAVRLRPRVGSRMLLIAAALVVLPPAGAQQQRSPAAAPPDAGAIPASSDDTHYDRVLQAYRFELSPEESAALGEEDLGPGLYADPKSPAEFGVTRVFAALPVEEHARLRATGYLKWRFDALPPGQQRTLREAVKMWERRGYGPFPLKGKDVALVGFARVDLDLDGVSGPLYSWWLAAPGKKDERPVWQTVVRAVLLGIQEYADAHREQLPPILEKPDTPTIPANRWRSVPAPPSPAVAERKARQEQRETERPFWDLVAAYRGSLRGTALGALTEADPLLGRRLKTTEPADLALNRFFGQLPEKEHRLLLTQGRLAWRMEQLSAGRRKLLEPVFRDLNSRLQPGAETTGSYQSAPYGGTTVGFLLLEIPGAPGLVVSWWARAFGVPGPTWVTLSNGRAVTAPAYYRLHLEALR